MEALQILTIITACLFWIGLIGSIIYSGDLGAHTLTVSGFTHGMVAGQTGTVDVYLKFYAYGFLLTSAISDTIQAIEYDQILARTNDCNWILWAEYSIGAPLMAGIFSYTSGGTDIFAHVLMMGLIHVCILI